MCGITGVFNFNPNQPVEQGVIRRMTDAIQHRGPDDEGYYFDNNLGFGFRRLSIIDLSGGHQPMLNDEKTIAVIFNGEIYNYLELKTELTNLGFKFRTNSDTEVILHGFLAWGKNVFRRLNGMFGIGIWDKREREMILARDRMGIKFVYYTVEAGTVVFGSEIRPILQYKEHQPDIDPESLFLFLTYRYTPAPLTIYKDIYKLSPGTIFSIKENADPVITSFVTAPPPKYEKKPDRNTATEELLTLYREAIKRQVMSDVPLGLLLSGGVDSAMLLSLMSEIGSDWHTFTIGYGSNYKNDELADAAETAAMFGSQHHTIEIDQHIFENSLTDVIRCLEEPIASASIVPMYFVCQKAREYVKVALMGQGPDELFGGYKRHLGTHYGMYWRKLPGFIKSSIKKIAEKQFSGNEPIQRAVHSLDTANRLERYLNILALMPETHIRKLFHHDLLPQHDNHSANRYWTDFENPIYHLDELGGLQYIEMRSTLPEELLMYADKLSMANSLEVRVPYLDQEIVNYTEQLDASFKIRFGHQKWIHRNTCRKHLPKSIINRKKRAFAKDVVNDWFNVSCNSRLNETIIDRESYIYNYLNPDHVMPLLKSHQSGNADNHKLLFSLIVFEEWLRMNHQPSLAVA